MGFTVFIAIIALSIAAGPLLTPIPSVVEQSIAHAEEDELAEVGAGTPLAEQLRSRWLDPSAPISIAVGDRAALTVKVQNIGHVPWIKGTPSELRVGEVGANPLPAAMRGEWLHADRPAVQNEAVVRPQQVATFTVSVKGSTPGIYRLQLRPVVDGVTWLDDEGIHVDISVL
jgi:hypothetical protein